MADWAGTGAASTTEPMSAYKDISGNYIPQRIIDAQKSYQQAGSAPLDAARSASDAKLDSMRRRAAAAGYTGPIVTAPDGTFGTTGKTFDELFGPETTPSSDNGFAGVQSPNGGAPSGIINTAINTTTQPSDNGFAGVQSPNGGAPTEPKSVTPKLQPPVNDSGFAGVQTPTVGTPTEPKSITPKLQPAVDEVSTIDENPTIDPNKPQPYGEWRSGEPTSPKSVIPKMPPPAEGGGFAGVQTPSVGTGATTQPVKMEEVARPSIGGGGGSTSWQVDPNTMTVEGRLGKLMDPNNPLMQQAQTQAAQASAARGILNSSMAVTAGQDAMYRAATPIANADAQMYGKSASDNAANATSLSNAATSAAASMYGADKSAAASKYAVDTGTSNLKYSLEQNQQNDLQKMAVQNGFDLSKMDKQAAITLSQMSVQQINDLKKMATAQGYNLESMSADQVNQMARLAAQQSNDLEKLTLQNGFDLNKMDKQAAITLGQMDKQLQNTLVTMAKQQGYNLETMSAQQVNDLSKMAVAQNYVQANMGLQQSFDITKMDKAAAITLAQMDKQHLNTLSQMSTQYGYDLEKMTRTQAYAMAQIDANATNSQKLAAMNIDATKALNIDNQNFTRMINGSNAALNVFKTLQGDLAAIDLNTDGGFTAEAKTTMKNNRIADAQDALSLIASNSNDPALTSFINSLIPKKK